MSQPYANWRKASASTTQGGNCVEVAFRAGVVGVRDSKQQGSGPVLEFAADAWERFSADIRRDAFGLS